MNKKLWVLNVPYEDEAVEVAELFEAPAAYAFFDVVSLKGKFNDDSKIYLSDDCGPKLYDFIYNANKLLIVSDRAKVLLESVSGADVEFFPVELIDASGESLSSAYWVLNILKVHPVIDVNNSELEYSAFDRSRIDDFSLLKLNIDLDVDSKLFRPLNAPGLYMISEELKKLFEDSKLEGYKLYEADGWDGNTLSFEWDPS